MVLVTGSPPNTPTMKYATSGEHSLGFVVYADPGHQKIFGDGTEGTATIFVHPPYPHQARIYIRAPANQKVSPGHYSVNLQMIMQEKM